MSQGRLVVLAGPTAVGKGTVAEHIRAEYPQVWISVSATTRPPRPGEIDGLHYHFVDDETFERMARDGELLEWAVVLGRAKGARQVRASMPEALFVFLAPPSWDELVRRLIGRGTESAEEREIRLTTARAELAAAEEFDVVLTNDNVERVAADLVSLMGSPSVSSRNEP